MVAAACLHGICKSKRGQCPSPKLSLYMWGRTSHFQKFKSLPFDLFLDFEMKVPGNSALRCQLIFLLCYCEIFYFSPLSLRSCGLNLYGRMKSHDCFFLNLDPEDTENRSNSASSRRRITKSLPISYAAVENPFSLLSFGVIFVQFGKGC